jgi:hypothetical protein
VIDRQNLRLVRIVREVDGGDRRDLALDPGVLQPPSGRRAVRIRRLCGGRAHERCAEAAEPDDAEAGAGRTGVAEHDDLARAGVARVGPFVELETERRGGVPRPDPGRLRLRLDEPRDRLTIVVGPDELVVALDQRYLPVGVDPLERLAGAGLEVEPRVAEDPAVTGFGTRHPQQRVLPVKEVDQNVHDESVAAVVAAHLHDQRLGSALRERGRIQFGRGPGCSSVIRTTLPPGSTRSTFTLPGVVHSGIRSCMEGLYHRDCSTSAWRPWWELSISRSPLLACEEFGQAHLFHRDQPGPEERPIQLPGDSDDDQGLLDDGEPQGETARLLLFDRVAAHQVGACVPDPSHERPERAEELAFVIPSGGMPFRRRRWKAIRPPPLV